MNPLEIDSERYLLEVNCNFFNFRPLIIPVKMSDEIGSNRENHSDSSAPFNSSESAPSPPPPPPPEQSQTYQDVPAKMIDHFKAHKVDSAMWALRMLAIFFALLYIFPIFG